MKTKLTYMLFAGLAVLVSCTKQNSVSEDGNSSKHPGQTVTMDFRASVPQGLEVKTILGEAVQGHHSVSWAQGDKVRIVCGGSTVDADVALDGAITADVPVSDVYYAIYPLCEVKGSSPLSIVIPVEQDGSFASAGIMAAKTDAKDRNFAFRNLSGLLSFEITREDITRVVIHSNTASALSGTAELSFDGGTLACEMVEPFDSVAVTIDGPGVYYAAVAGSADMAAGFAMRLYAGDEPLPGILSIQPIKAESTSLWNLGMVDAVVHEGNYFIKVDGEGDGSSWDSAGGPELLRNLLNTRISESVETDGVGHSWRVDGKKIYLAAGEYNFDENFGNPYSSLCAGCDVEILGGCPANSTGIMIERNPDENPTVFTSEEGSVFTIAGSGSYTFDGIDFKNIVTKGNGSAINYASDGRLVLRNCKFEANKAAQSGGAVFIGAGEALLQNCLFASNEAAAAVAYSKDPGNYAGGALYVMTASDAAQGTMVGIDHCRFLNNVTGTHGAHLEVYTASLYETCTCYVNASLFKGGYSDNSGGSASVGGNEMYFGRAIVADAAQNGSHCLFAMNNCTCADNTSKWVGTSVVEMIRSKGLFVNSTFYDKASSAVLKNLTRGKETVPDGFYLTNCIVSDSNSATANAINIENTADIELVAGNNIIGFNGKNKYPQTGAPGDTQIAFSSMNWNWDEKAMQYTWNSSVPVNSYTTRDDVRTFVQDYMPGFDKWLQSVESDPYGVDYSGNSRTPSKLNVGSWDKGL